MIIVKNITYSIGAKTILKDVNFTIAKGEKVGLVGINGVGKSTLFKLMLKILSPDKGSVTFSRSISGIGYMPQTVSEISIPKRQLVFDFLLSGRPVKEIEKKMNLLMEALASIKDDLEQKKALDKLGHLQEEFDFWGGHAAENELLRIIDGLRLDGIDLNAEVNNLSGGEKSKVNFARVLYSHPSVLLLDEPTNHLDKKSREWLIGFLGRYYGSVLIISHDASFLNAVATKIIHLDEVSRSAEIFFCNYSRYLKVRKHNLESQEHQGEVQEKKVQQLKKFIDSMHNVSGKRKRQVKSREKALKKLLITKIDKRPRFKEVRIKLSPKRDGHEVLLNIRDLHFGYSKEKEIIKGVSFSLMRNERFVIVGENGSGKTTLLKLITGILKSWKGEIEVTGKTDMGYYTQEHEGISMENTVLEEVSSISALPQRALRSILGRFLFYGDMVFQKVVTLSPGERSRLALAKLSLTGSNLLLLDEPTNHLDRNTSESVAKIFREYGGAVIVVSHDFDFLEALGVERMLFLPQGKIQGYDHSVIEHLRSQDGC